MSSLANVASEPKTRRGPSLRIRVSREMYDLIENIAKVHYDGNISMAARKLILRGIQGAANAVSPDDNLEENPATNPDKKIEIIPEQRNCWRDND